MEKKESEEILDDGLQSQSLEDVESCSSSILDSDEEDDGINVTIREVTFGASGEGSAGKLAGAARRKMKKKIADGIDEDKAHAEVIASTPKRSRDVAMESPNSSIGNKPVPKKVCDTVPPKGKKVVGDNGATGKRGSTESVPQEAGKEKVGGQEESERVAEEDDVKMEVDAVKKGVASGSGKKVEGSAKAGGGQSDSSNPRGRGGNVEK